LPVMVPRVESVVEKHAAALPADERAPLSALVAGLPKRLEAIESCGVPNTLVHGDFHPGNVVGRPDAYVLLDWGDCFVGNPLIDELAFTERLDEPGRAVAGRWFVDAWRRIAPGSDPERAADLLRPVLPLLAAVTYAGFCAGIEPDERVYHESDIARMLHRAVVEEGRAHAW
jgi:Ser/Thr protein kinase RdoA (MazF antagonist)